MATDMRAHARPTGAPAAAARHTASGAAVVTLSIGSRLVIEPDYPEELRAAVRRRFMIPNPLYADAVRFDRDARDMPAHLLYYDVRPDGALIVLRGALELVYRDCLVLGLDARWTDGTHMAAAVNFEERLELSPAQGRAVGVVVGRRRGRVDARAGIRAGGLRYRDNADIDHDAGEDRVSGTAVRPVDTKWVQK